jgi:hypothetical protein
MTTTDRSQPSASRRVPRAFRALRTLWKRHSAEDFVIREVPARPRSLLSIEDYIAHSAHASQHSLPVPVLALSPVSDTQHLDTSLTLFAALLREFSPRSSWRDAAQVWRSFVSCLEEGLDEMDFCTRVLTVMEDLVAEGVRAARVEEYRQELMGTLRQHSAHPQELTELVTSRGAETEAAGSRGRALSPAKVRFPLSPVTVALVAELRVPTLSEVSTRAYPEVLGQLRAIAFGVSAMETEYRFHYDANGHHPPSSARSLCRYQSSVDHATPRHDDTIHLIHWELARLVGTGDMTPRQALITAAVSGLEHAVLLGYEYILEAHHEDTAIASVKRARDASATIQRELAAGNWTDAHTVSALRMLSWLDVDVHDWEVDVREVVAVVLSGEAENMPAGIWSHLVAQKVEPSAYSQVTQRQLRTAYLNIQQWVTGDKLSSSVSVFFSR